MEKFYFYAGKERLEPKIIKSQDINLTSFPLAASRGTNLLIPLENPRP